LNVEKAETILDAANKVFIKYGYQKTTMDDIAHEAMIGKGTIYYYFNSKEEIFIEILKKIKEETNLKIAEKMNSASTFEEKFKIFFTEPLQQFVSHYKLFIQVMSEQSPAFMTKLHDFRASTHEGIKDMLTTILEEAKENGTLKPEYINSVDRLANIIFKWMFITGEHVRINFLENTINDLIDDYTLFSDVLINGLTIQEEKL
jgi:AcrR family transcriptional regulator